MTKLEQMREVFSRLEGSGLSMKAFAAREGISELAWGTRHCQPHVALGRLQKTLRDPSPSGE